MANDVHEEIMGQIYIAFGQGAGSMRVSRKTCAELRKRYYPKIAKALDHWDREGAQALERVRALGRMIAAEATAKGLSAIIHSGTEFERCATAVEKSSGETAALAAATIFCDN
jgi:hypothetical protein